MPKFDRDRGGSRGGFKSRRGFDRPTLYDATCADCGKETKVPFRPTGERAVYCRDCFARRGGGEERGRQAGARGVTQNSHSPQNIQNIQHTQSMLPRPVTSTPNLNNEKVERQLEQVNEKLERLILAVESLAAKKAVKKTVKKK